MGPAIQPATQGDDVDEKLRQHFDEVIQKLPEPERSAVLSLPERSRYLVAAIKDMYLPDYQDAQGTKPPVRLITLANGDNDYFALDGNAHCQGCSDAFGLVDIKFHYIDPTIIEGQSPEGYCRQCAIKRAEQSRSPVMLEVFISKSANLKSVIVEALIDDATARAHQYLSNSTINEGAPAATLPMAQA